MASPKIVKKIFAIFFISSFSLSFVHAQTDSTAEVQQKAFIYRATFHYGALVGYKEGDPVFLLTNPFGIELSATKLASGKKRWERMYNHPSKVFALAYYNYGIPHDFGEAFTATASFDFNLMRRPRNKLWFTTGIGVVYSTRKFNEDSNPDNKNISSDISYVLQGSLRYDYQWTKNFIVSPSLSFRHFSNATLNIPNNGMNFPLIGVGLSYQTRPAPNTYQRDTIKTFDKKLHFTFSGGLAIKKVLTIDERHKIYCASFYLDRQITKYNTILIGADAFYNTSLHSEYIKYGQTVDEDSIDHRQLAITLGQELFIGKIGIITQGAFFVYQPHKFRSSVYQKYGIKYYITKDLFLGAIIKVFAGTADYMEWAVGVKL